MNFTKEGVYITKGGYFKTCWNPTNKSYYATQIRVGEIESELNNIVVLEDGVRLKDIFVPILNSKVMPILFKNDYWTEMVLEAKTKKWKEWIGDVKPLQSVDGDEIDYLEVCQQLTYSKKENKFKGLMSHWDFHGIGFPFKDKSLAKEYYTNIGERMSFAVEFNSLADLMNFPVKVGQVDVVEEDRENYTNNNVITKASGEITLYTLIHSIVWELSFCGVGVERDELLSDAVELMEDIQCKGIGF
jgi:hypothetical protein